jgi:site-specific recombinase XerD
MSESLEQTAQRYLQRWRPTLRPASIHGKKQALNNLIGYLREHHPEVHHFNELQRCPHIEGWLEHLLYLKASSRITVIRILRLFFGDLVQWEWAQAPTTRLLSNEDLPPQPRTLPKPLAPEIDQALQDVLWRAYTFPAMAMLLLRLTGMRIGEMRALSLHALEGPHAGEFSLHLPLGKTHAERLIPLCPKAVGLVRDILAQRGARKPIPSAVARYMMINQHGRHLREQTYRNELKVLAAQLNSTERIYPHRLRHTFATQMARAGMPLPALMKLLGHRCPQMTMLYVEVAHTDLRQAYDQALTQLRGINRAANATLPASPAPGIQPQPDELPKLLAAVASGLEKLRRDECQPARARELHRFLKRIRRTQHDLQNLL